MLFFPTRRTNLPSTRRGVSRPYTQSDPTDGLWMLKSFAMGVTLLGFSYWLVQLAGVQYLASLTSVTLLAFLLAYVVWCVLHRNKIARQRSAASNRNETAARISPSVEITEPATVVPPPPFDHHQAFKYVARSPDRDQSPPPTYEEAILAMMRNATCTPEVMCHHPVFPTTWLRPSQQEQTANLASPVPTVSVSRSNSSVTQLSPSALMSSPPPSALSYSLPSPSALGPYSSPVTQTFSALARQESGLTPLSQAGESSQPPSTLTQTSPTAVTPASTVVITPAEYVTPRRGEVS